MQVCRPDQAGIPFVASGTFLAQYDAPVNPGMQAAGGLLCARRAGGHP